MAAENITREAILAEEKRRKAISFSNTDARDRANHRIRALENPKACGGCSYCLIKFDRNGKTLVPNVSCKIGHEPVSISMDAPTIAQMNCPDFKPEKS